MSGTMSAMSTALPRMRAATVTWSGVLTGIPVPFSIRTRISATMLSATKKKIVGGRIARISSPTFAARFLIVANARLLLFHHRFDPSRAHRLPQHGVVSFTLIGIGDREGRHGLVEG